MVDSKTRPLVAKRLRRLHRDFGSDLRGQRSKIQPTIASGATAPMQKQMMVWRKRTWCMGETA
jgi:hypothetical protein